jgi:hypothetical protein
MCFSLIAGLLVQDWIGRSMISGFETGKLITMRISKSLAHRVYKVKIGNPPQKN